MEGWQRADCEFGPGVQVDGLDRSPIAQHAQRDSWQHAWGKPLHPHSDILHTGVERNIRHKSSVCVCVCGHVSIHVPDRGRVRQCRYGGVRFLSLYVHVELIQNRNTFHLQMSGVCCYCRESLLITKSWLLLCSNPHLCCPDARDLLRQTLVGWWEVTPHSWTPPVCPGKTPARRLQAVCLAERPSAWPGPLRRFSVQTWGGRLRWTAPATDTRWSLGCCNARWGLGLCVRFLCRDAELERSWCHWSVLMGSSWYCLKTNQCNVMLAYVEPCPHV